ncbi:AAA family ATPase [Nocardioides sp. HB32]
MQVTPGELIGLTAQGELMDHIKPANRVDPRILGVHIPAYKNLRDVWIPWRSGLALVGANGSGKTNILEALALLIGTEATLRRGAARMDFSAAPGISLVLAEDHHRMPLHDERALLFDPEDWPGTDYEQLRADTEWCKATEFDPNSTDWAAATVRYTLQSIDEQNFRRVFARTLLSATLDTSLAMATDPGVLTLSPTMRPPASLQWLPAGRSEEEVHNELHDQFIRALPKLELLVKSLDEVLPVAATPEDPSGSAHWLLHELAARAGATELAATAPDVILESEGSNDADWRIGVRMGGRVVDLGLVGAGTVLDRLSAGQRRWVDEALASMSRELNALTSRAELFATFVGKLPDDLLERAVLDHPEADLQIVRDEFWDRQTFDALLGALEPALVEKAATTYKTDPMSQQLTRVLMPYFTALDSQLVVRVIDEPEAHLHPKAERSVAAALETLRNSGEDIVIASHSAAFVDRPDWRTVHVRDGRVHVVDDATAVVRSELARDLGITRGELLAGIAHILVVEGEHDQVVLETLFGPSLRAAGIAIIRMSGTHNIGSMADLDFVERYVDVDLTVMLDNVRLGRMDTNDATPEEKKLRYLRREARRRGRTFAEIPLERPDIVCYLSETAIRLGAPGFPGWRQVLATRPNKPHTFKPWLKHRYGLDLTTTRHVAAVAQHMKDQGLRPAGELEREISALVAKVSGLTI